MLTDPNFLWNRVASIALNNNGTRFSSPFCISGSTGQPTSLSGGGSNVIGIGPQTPPPGAKSSVAGGLVNGTVIMGGVGGSAGNINGTTRSNGTATRASAPVTFTGEGGKMTFGRLGILLPFVIAAVVQAMVS
jgi:hypothetical protein